MNQTLTLTDDLFQSLQKMAQERHATPEEAAAYWLDIILHEVQDEPLLRLAGSVKSELTDVGANHDSYIGHALCAEMRGGEDG
jgi:hypothetical protein